MSSGDEKVKFQGIEIAYPSELDGGGTRFGQDFVPVVEGLFGHVRHVFDFCAGPGFIGLSLLAHGLCDFLTLADVNPAAVAVARAAVRRNGLGRRVAVYESDGLRAIPRSESWNLVVSNPPHFGSPMRSVPNRITDDLNWSLHRHLYLSVGDFLAPGGSVLLQENSSASCTSDFLPFVEAGGLRQVQSFRYTEGVGGDNFYFLWTQRAMPGLRVDPQPVQPACS